MKTTNGVQTWKPRALKKLDMALPLKGGGLLDWHRPLSKIRSSKTLFLVVSGRPGRRVGRDSLALF